MKNLYAVLMVTPSANLAEISDAYMSLKKDAVAAGNDTSDYDAAYAILANASKRQAYDIELTSQTDKTESAPEAMLGVKHKVEVDQKFMEPWELAHLNAEPSLPLKRDGEIKKLGAWRHRNHLVIWGSLIIATLIFLLIRVLLVEKDERSSSHLFEQSLTQRKDLRLIPGFNEAMCKTLDAAGPKNTCEKITGVLDNLAKEIAIVLPNQDKGFTFQVNCMTAVDKADGHRKCQEGVLMTVFDDNSMTIMHFRNSDLDYLIGASKRVFVEHPMIGFIYAGKGKYSKNIELPELAINAIHGFDEEYASGTHRDVLLKARRDSSAEILNVSRPTFLSFVEE